MIDADDGMEIDEGKGSAALSFGYRTLFHIILASIQRRRSTASTFPIQVFGRQAPENGGFNPPTPGITLLRIGVVLEV
jgi:hypothetical protein